MLSIMESDLGNQKHRRKTAVRVWLQIQLESTESRYETTATGNLEHFNTLAFLHMKVCVCVCVTRCCAVKFAVALQV